MTSPRITHIALHVKDLDACIDFYQTFCDMSTVHQRVAGKQRIVWMAEEGRVSDFIFVMLEGGENLSLSDQDYRHFGFAVGSQKDVDDIAVQAEAQGCLIWPPREEPFPVGYYCGLRDPNGNYVEFSYGQPLGPGAERLLSNKKE